MCAQTQSALIVPFQVQIIAMARLLTSHIPTSFSRINLTTKKLIWSNSSRRSRLSWDLLVANCSILRWSKIKERTRQVSFQQTTNRETLTKAGKSPSTQMPSQQQNAEIISLTSLIFTAQFLPPSLAPTTKELPVTPQSPSLRKITLLFLESITIRIITILALLLNQTLGSQSRSQTKDHISQMPSSMKQSSSGCLQKPSYRLRIKSNSRSRSDLCPTSKRLDLERI